MMSNAAQKERGEAIIMTAELLDEGRTVLIDGIRIAVDLIAKALITDSPRRQVTRQDSADGYILSAIESYRKDDIVYYRSTRHLLETDADGVLTFLGLTAPRPSIRSIERTSREETEHGSCILPMPRWRVILTDGSELLFDEGEKAAL